MNEFVARKGLLVPSGNVLIGTTSSSGVDKVRVNNDGTTSYSTVNITNANSTANMYLGVGGSSVSNGSLQNNAYVWNAAASALVLGTSDIERIRITSVGNVGIGTTIPGTSPNNTLLGFALGSNIQARTAVPQLVMSSNIDGDWYAPTYKTSNFASQIYIDANQGVIGLRTASSGTAGNAITWNTPAILIANNSNVGIGTASPSYPLSIENTAEYPLAYKRLVGTSKQWAFGADNTSTYLRNITDGITAYTVTNTGNVGIGTTAPSNTAGFSRQLQIEGTYPALTLKNVTGTAGWFSLGAGSNGDFGIWNNTTSTYPIYINSSNNVGIGTTAPIWKLGIVGNSGGNGMCYIQNTTTNTEAENLTINYTAIAPNNSDGSFISCGDTLDVRFVLWNNGGIGNFQANDVDLSDERTKNSISLLESYWDKIKNIEIVKYKYNNQTHDDYNIGVVAQQVEEIAPEFINTDSWKIKDSDECYKTVYNKDLYFAAIKTLQEAIIKIENLEKEIETLKNK